MAVSAGSESIEAVITARLLAWGFIVDEAPAPEEPPYFPPATTFFSYNTAISASEYP